MFCEQAYNCAKSISSEILIGGPSNYVSHPYELIADPWDFDPLFAEPHVHPGMGVYINHGENSILQQYAGNLSAGTQGVYLWVLYISLKIWWDYMIIRDGTEISAWKNHPAILLIDEIENHLHPTWQRRVIPALLDHFPGLQIFATTHSPFVVAGLKAGQVHLLRRDENGVTATTNTEDVIGWTADEILRTMMGVDDPTDDATAAAARELRQLRQEPPRANPEDEARRQERMQELRQQVDRDLLAGGPMEAQRELFEQQFADVMKRYRQNQELNQEKRIILHSVQRSPEPGFFAAIRAAKTRWDDLEPSDRRRIRDALVRDFGPICAYCERPCQSPTRAEKPDEESIDHFNPRRHFSDQWLDWLNLIYACRRCNQRKSDSWPGHDDELTNRLLAAEDPRYTPVSEYVDPNAANNKHPARDFFSFDISSGEIVLSDNISSEEWSIARRTISDIDLNDISLGDNDPGNLRQLRRYRLYLMIEALIAASGDLNLTNRIISESLSPHSPFSAYVAAYVNSPQFGALKRRPLSDHRPNPPGTARNPPAALSRP